MVEDELLQDRNTSQMFLIESRVSGDCQDVASYQLAFQYAGQLQNAAVQYVLLLLMHQILCILKKVNQCRSYPVSLYQDICQTAGKKSLLHSYFLSPRSY